MSSPIHLETTPPPPRRTRLRLWIVGMAGVLAVAALLRLGYPLYRQKQIVAELQAKGLTVEVYPLFDDKWPKWMTGILDRVLIQGASLYDDTGVCTDNDLRLISELFALTYDGIDGIPSCDLMLFANTLITDAGLFHLRGARNLRSLDLESGRVTDAGLANLVGLPLNYLVLTSNPISDAGLAHLEHLQSLENLTLSHTPVTAAGLVHLLKLKRLKILRLSGRHVGDDAIHDLMRFTSLTQLDLSGTRITNKGVAKIRDALPNTDVSW